MPRQSAYSVENNFKNGLITEATGLGFPESACTETWNCEFDLDGSVSRRLGFEFESGYVLKDINRNNFAINTYLWNNVGGTGDLSLVVQQTGSSIYFYEINEDDSFSSGAIVDTIVLNGISAPATEVEIYEAQYSNGNGLLVITHPLCHPILVTYDPVTKTVDGALIILKIRDFEGAQADPYAVSERPTSTYAALNVNHKYNLLNQGWLDAQLTAWDTAHTTMPSNADVMWRFRDTNDALDMSATAVDKVVSGNTPAPKGHFILSLFNQNRDAASGLTGVAATTTGKYAPSTSAFFAGRVFYSGINTAKFNSDIYFTKIIENDVADYSQCHQTNDPTSYELFDLLPSDGGVISIPEAGTIYKLFTVPGGLSVHAENGVWFVTGSTGIGFTANDYTVQKIANIPTLTQSSFVNVAGYPSWWNSEGIYIMIAQGNLPQIQSLTDAKIKTFFRDIPLNSKRFARGIYHYTDGHIRWIYRSTEAASITETYEFDRVLNFNVNTGAFYPWTISDSDVKVNSIIVSDLLSGNIQSLNVIDGSGNNVVDALGNQVIAFSNTGGTSVPFDKYLVSYRDGSSFKFTFASKINANYLDWFEYDLIERSYDSYFITGYKIRGHGIRKFQSNWVRVYSRTLEPVAYYFQGMWDYALSGNTGRWSSQQFVEHTDTNYSHSTKRLKVRGHGLVLQFKVHSVDQKPFDIVGWSCLETANALP